MGYAFWQIGMVQYICEQFDTRDAKMAGVSSGAICIALVLAFEKAASAGEASSASLRVRARAQEIFRIVEKHLTPVARWPVGFVARLGTVLDKMGMEVVPDDTTADLNRRIRIGMRRLSGRCIPALIPDSINEFSTGQDLVRAISVSSHVGIVVRPLPVTYLESRGAWCSDGCNPFSFYCLFEYLIQLRRGLTQRTAPAHIRQGLDYIYALWNCGTMRLMLPRDGSNLWITPTVGGNLDLKFCLRVSGWWAGEQWRRGYAHARELDAQGYWNKMPRRMMTAENKV